MKRILRSQQRGQGLVEFAVIFPIFVVLIFALIDGGLVMGRYNNLTNGAKEGARLGAVSTNAATAKANIVKRVQDQSHGALTGASTNCADYNNAAKTKVICVEWIPGPGGSPAAGSVGSSVRVKVKYKNKFLTPLSSFIDSGPGWVIKECAVQRLEQSLAPPVTGTGDSC